MEKLAGFDRHMAEARFALVHCLLFVRKINWASCYYARGSALKKMLIALLFYERRLKMRRDC